MYESMVSKQSKKIFSFLFPLSFILNGYSSGLPGISLGSLIIVIYMFLAFMVLALNNRNLTIGSKGIYTKPFLIVVFYIFISGISIVLTNVIVFDTYNMLFDLIKLITWAFTITVSSYIFLDYNSFRKSIIILSIIATSYLVFQYLLWYGISYRLPNIFSFPFLKPYVDDYIIPTGFADVTYSFFRPASFFSEPAFYSDFVFCALVMVWFSDMYSNRKKNRIITFFVLGLLLSTSTSGIYLTFGLILYVILKNIYQRKYSLKILSFVSIAFIITILVLLTSDIFSSDSSTFINTILYTIRKPLEFMNSTRIGKSFNYLKILTSDNLLLGVGYGNYSSYLLYDNTYLNSVTTLIFNTGFIGLFVFTLWYLSLFRYFRDSIVLILLISYGIKLVSSGIMFSIYGILFMTIIIYRIYYNNKKIEGKAYLSCDMQKDK